MAVQSVTINGVTWHYSASPAAWPSMTPGIKVTGKYGVNTQFSGAGNDVMTGGGGGSDNIFYVNGNDTVIAPGGPSGDRYDTEISYWGSLTLAANVIDGVIGNGPGTLTGNNLNNILTVQSTYAVTVIGGGGDDLMIGSPSGNDRFVVDASNGGSAVIENFVYATDVLQLSNFTQFAGANLQTVEAAMTQSGGNVILTLNATQSVTFVGATIAQFIASDFAVPAAPPPAAKPTFDDEFKTLSVSASGIGTMWQYLGGPLPTQANDFLAASSGANSPFSITSNGLTITASPVSTAAGLPYTSGGLTTQGSFTQTYGLFEISAKLPSGTGMWPAFWLLPANGAPGVELDAFEALGNNPYTVYGTTHSAITGSTTVPATVTINTSASFNTYGVDWEPTTTTFYFNGNAIASLPTPADMNTPMYLLLDLGVGAAGSWPGAATGETGSFQVQWVRAYASANTAVTLSLNGWGAAISRGNGDFTITGNGYNGTILLGNGNQAISLSAPAGQYGASADTITVGDGNDNIALSGSYNTVTTGSGTSSISIGGGGNTVTIGATPVDTTVLTIGGYGNTITSTGTGNVSISGMTGGSTIKLMAGNDTIALGGANNTVTTGAGNAVITGGTGQDTITTGAGNSTIAVSGYNNVLDAGPGNNSITGGSGNDRFILNAAGQGVDTIAHLVQTDILDLTQTLKGLAVLTTAASIESFVTAQIVGSNTAIYVDPQGHGAAGSEIAVLQGVKTTMAALYAGNNLELGTKVV